MDWGAIGMGAGGIASAFLNANAAEEQAKAQKYSADVQAAVQREQIAQQGVQFGQQFGLTKSEAEAKRAAYNQAKQQAMQQMNQGEQGIQDYAQTANPELAQMSTDIQTGNAAALQQGAGQMQTALAQQGVRGGQAVTQLNRGIGQQAIGAQQNINQMLGQDSQQRRAQLAAYNQAKALQGQQTGLSVM